MCAIFGIGFMHNHRIKNSKAMKLIVKNMFALSQDRGRRATGIAVTNEKDVIVLKKDLPASTFVNEQGYVDFVDRNIDFENPARFKRPISIIGHCRLNTKGSPTNNNNNHPIVAENIIGVHNGHINNDDYLFKIFPEMHRRAEVDSEVIFRLINFFAYKKAKKGVVEVVDAIKQTAVLLQGGFACGFVTAKNPHMLYIFRDSAPIDVIYYPKVGVVMFSTSNRFIKKAVEVGDFGEKKEIPCPMNSGIVFNLHMNRMHKFKLKEERETIIRKRTPGFVTNAVG